MPVHSQPAFKKLQRGENCLLMRRPEIKKRENRSLCRVNSGYKTTTSHGTASVKDYFSQALTSLSKHTEVLNSLK